MRHPDDPWHGINTRYRLYCLAHGWQTPEEATAKPQQYIGWIVNQVLMWKLETGNCYGLSMTDADHAAFDAWLTAKVEGDKQHG